MFKLSEIKDLVKLVDQSSINELEIENEGSRLRICKAAHQEASPVLQPLPQPGVPVQLGATAVQAAQAAAEPAPEVPQAVGNKNDQLHRIVSPMVGTFYEASSPGAGPFVKIGDSVKEKSVVCIIEAMKLMNEIEAEVKGKIVEVLVENGQLVEYGQPLFLVEKE